MGVNGSSLGAVEMGMLSHVTSHSTFSTGCKPETVNQSPRDWLINAIRGTWLSSSKVPHIGSGGPRRRGREPGRRGAVCEPQLIGPGRTVFTD